MWRALVHWGAHPAERALPKHPQHCALQMSIPPHKKSIQAPPPAVATPSPSYASMERPSNPHSTAHAANHAPGGAHHGLQGMLAHASSPLLHVSVR